MKKFIKRIMNNRWMVVALLFTIHCSLFTSEAFAQPKARRQQQQQTQQRAGQKAGQKQTQQSQGMSMRARLMFPTLRMWYGVATSTAR